MGFEWGESYLADEIGEEISEMMDSLAMKMMNKAMNNIAEQACSTLQPDCSVLFWVTPESDPGHEKDDSFEFHSLDGDSLLLKFSFLEKVKREVDFLVEHQAEAERADFKKGLLTLAENLREQADRLA